MINSCSFSVHDFFSKAIIEALKYAITGAMPPGVKSGQAFVHDPKSAGQSNVKASIKLRFTNRGGNKMVVVRSMEVTQKKTTLTFKALDGVLRTTNPETGERISMSHKCTELDRQIPTMIGVRLAVVFNLLLTLLTLYSKSNTPPLFVPNSSQQTNT